MQIDKIILIRLRLLLITGFFYLGALAMLLMSMHFFQNEISGILKYKDVSSNFYYRLCFKSHIFFGIIAITVGPSQILFNSTKKQALKHIHRKIGYLYIVSVLTSAMTGLVVAQYAMGGWVSSIGFSFLAIFWITTILLAIIAIKKKQVKVHQKWMYINYGLTFAAITQRILLLLPLLFEFDFLAIYRLSAWLPWMLNTGISILIYNKVSGLPNV